MSKIHYPNETINESHLISAGLLVGISGFMLFLALAAYSLSDVHNKWDFVLPLVATAQFVIAIFVYLLKRWALVLYTIFLIVLYAYIYYFYRDKANVAIETIAALSPPLIIVLYIWLFRRDRLE